MDIKNLSKEERAELLAELKAEETAKIEAKKRQQETYRELVDEFVKKNIAKLEALSSEMMRVKEEHFSDSETLIEMKNELFKVKGDRRTDQLTTRDGRMTLQLGRRTYEGWDDTVDAGVQIVKEYMASLATDETTGAEIETIMRLLSRDQKGNLKASKVLELDKLAKRTGDERLMEGIEIIKSSYRPVPSVQFIEASVKDAKGVSHSIPLSLSALKEV